MKRNARVLAFLLSLSHHYGLKAQKVRQRKGVEHLHTRRLERISKHLRAAHDGIAGDRADELEDKT